MCSKLHLPIIISNAIFLISVIMFAVSMVNEFIPPVLSGIIMGLCYLGYLYLAFKHNEFYEYLKNVKGTNQKKRTMKRVQNSKGKFIF